MFSERINEMRLLGDSPREAYLWPIERERERERALSLLPLASCKQTWGCIIDNDFIANIFQNTPGQRSKIALCFIESSSSLFF
jgi:hypothetical protein